MTKEQDPNKTKVLFDYASAKSRMIRSVSGVLINAKEKTTASGFEYIYIIVQENLQGVETEKTYRADRVVCLYDPHTGETLPHDPEKYFGNRLVQAGKPVPKNWLIHSVLMTLPTVTFSADGYAENWAFKVHTAFRRAIGIEWVDDVGMWLQGFPRLYSFSIGDQLPLRSSEYRLVISAAKPDKLVDGKLQDGSVEFEIVRQATPPEPAWTVLGRETVTQREFADILKNGYQGFPKNTG